jgi:uncharacterized membrane protein
MKQSTFQLTATAILSALTLLLGLTPLGLIPLGFINVTILAIPVIIGTLSLGLKSGLVLGLSFGLASLFRAFTSPSGLVAPLLQNNPVLVALMCLIPRLLIPLSASFIYRIFQRNQGAKKIALPLAAVAGSLTNTVLYLGLMLVFYIAAGLNAEAILTLISTTAAIAGGCEALAAAILTTPIVSAVSKIKFISDR